ncbi:MAG: hypothetical protein ACRDPR_06665 [Nocardioidaceae bacterium]
MTHPPDNPEDPAEGGPSARDEGAGRKLDEDAAWRSIVEHYGERPTLEPPPHDRPDPTSPDTPPGPPEDDDTRLRALFQPSWNDPLEPDDQDHFVPPAPGPIPLPDPRRRMAWAGLFGSPLLMLVAVVLGWDLPGWMMAVLVTGFAGGFVYLVATMQDRRPGDGPGGDGAVV